MYKSVEEEQIANLFNNNILPISLKGGISVEKKNIQVVKPKKKGVFQWFKSLFRVRNSKLTQSDA